MQRRRAAIAKDIAGPYCLLPDTFRGGRVDRIRAIGPRAGAELPADAYYTAFTLGDSRQPRVPRYTDRRRPCRSA